VQAELEHHRQREHEQSKTRADRLRSVDDDSAVAIPGEPAGVRILAPDVPAGCPTTFIRHADPNSCSGCHWRPPKARRTVEGPPAVRRFDLYANLVPPP
jgi:hypothetical protein